MLRVSIQYIDATIECITLDLYRPIFQSLSHDLHLYGAFSVLFVLRLFIIRYVYHRYDPPFEYDVEEAL